MLLSVRTPSGISYLLRPQVSRLVLSDRTKSMDWLRPRLPELADEVSAAVQAAVAEYRIVDRAVREGVRLAVSGCTALAEGGEPAGLPAREVYVQFGRGEARSGRTIAALLQAYRVGAQAAWRGVAQA